MYLPPRSLKTTSTLSELQEEAKWAVRGNWITRTEPLENFHRHYRPEVEETEKIVVQIPLGITMVRVYHFLHMFSGVQRDKDLEWYLTRIGAAAGFRVVTESLDLAYGDQNDLSLDETVERLRHRKPAFSGAHNGSPCSTWSRVRYRPGGPPPLRSREFPWGLPKNSKAQQAKCDHHNKLLKNSWTLLLWIAQAGGMVSNEHPADPSKHPYPSTWALAFVKYIERKAKMVRTVFPQCLWGLCAKKMTCVSANFESIHELDVHGNGSCHHKSHTVLLGKDEEGKFHTRRAQTYPPELCEKLAQLFVKGWIEGRGTPEWVSPAVLAQQEEEAEEEESQLGERVPVPEVSGTWDPIDRWSEVSRWVWKEEEHNNILEARAGVVSAKELSSSPKNWGKRGLLISDSQVVVGAFSKGRSSRRILNYLARKIAAISFGCNMRLYWRYIRTWRNHADGPSRGYPLGIAPKTEVKDLDSDGRDNQLKALPEIFYRISG